MGLFSGLFGPSENVTRTRPQVMEGLEPLVPQLSNLAQKAYGRPYQAYGGGARIAPFSGSQQAGMNAIRGIASDPSYRRGLGQAGEAIGSSMEDRNLQSMIRSLGRSIKPERTSTSRWTSPGVAESYMSPYKSQVIDQYLNREDKRTGERRAGLDAKLAGKRAFGSRGDIARTNFESDEEDRKAEAIASLLDKGYESGASRFAADEDRGLTSSTGNANRALSAEQLMTQGIGQGITGENTRLAGRRAAGNDLSSLTERYRTGNLDSARALMNVGQMEQTQAQRPLDLRYQDWTRQQNFPAEQASGLSRIVYGAPTGSTQTTPGPSGASQLLGAGIGIAGLGSGFGWWADGGAIHRRSGGPVRLAGGGDPLSEISDFEALKALDPREAAFLRTAAPHVQKARINDMKRTIYLNRFKHGAPSAPKFQRQPSYDDQTAEFMTPGAFGGEADPKLVSAMDYARSGGLPPTSLDLEAGDETQPGRRKRVDLPRIGPETYGDTTGGEYIGIGAGPAALAAEEEAAMPPLPLEKPEPPVRQGRSAPRGIGASAGPMSPHMREGREDAAPMAPPPVALQPPVAEPPANGGDGAGDPYSELLKKLVEAQDPKAGRGMILAKLGAAMASSRQPGFLGPVGEGIGAAARGMEDDQARRLRALGQAASIEERRQTGKERAEDRKRADKIRQEDLVSRGEDRKTQLKLAEERLAETKRQFDAGQAGQGELRAAQTEYYRAKAKGEGEGKDRSTFQEREVSRLMEEDPSLTRREALAIVSGASSREATAKARLENQKEDQRRKFISEATLGGMRAMTPAQQAEEVKLYGPRPDRSGASPAGAPAPSSPPSASPAPASAVSAKPPVSAGAPARPPSVPPTAQYSPSKKSWWWQENGTWRSAPSAP